MAAERRLRSVDAGERLLRLDITVGAAAASLVEAGPIAVVLVGLDGAVEVTLTADAVAAGAVGRATRRWALSGSTPVELLADAARSVGAPCVALPSSASRRTAASVLVDLEALGVLERWSLPSAGRRRVRGIAATLADVDLRRGRQPRSVSASTTAPSSITATPTRWRRSTTPWSSPPHSRHDGDGQAERRSCYAPGTRAAGRGNLRS